MRTAMVHYMIFLCLLCTVVTATGTTQDPMGSDVCAAPYFAAASASMLQDQPEVKKRVEPWYPELLKLAGIEGKVLVNVFIDEQGKVEKTKILESTHEAFSEAAVKAAKQWEFSPAMKEGKPIKAEVTIPFRFKLAEGSDKSKRAELMFLQEDVQKLLRGEAAANVKTQIGASAYAVVGNKFEYLSSLFSDKAKRDMLIEGPDSKIEMSRLAVGDAGDMAFLVLKTRPAAGKPERFHTVVFAKSSEGKWTIAAWHAGS
jgi:TonB family protein